MTDKEEGASAKSDTGQAIADASPSPYFEDVPFGAYDQPEIANRAQHSGKPRYPNPLRLFDRLAVNEWLTLLVAFGGLVVSILTYINAADTSDLKSAVKGLTVLAVQTKREADLMADANGQTQSIANEANRRIDGQVLAARSSANAAVLGVHQQETNFTLDERPIIANDICKEEVTPGIVYKETERFLGWNYCLKNYGKTTATHIASTEYISILGRPFVVYNLRGHRRVGDMVPGSGNWSTVSYPEPATLDQFSAAAGQAAGIIAAVEIKYTDLEGRPYRSTVCFSKNVNGTIASCDFDEMLRLSNAMVQKNIDDQLRTLKGQR